jgi:hypothetical protein
MIIRCDTCSRYFDDEFRSTACPHDTFAANDGNNNFSHHPESWLSDYDPTGGNNRAYHYQNFARSLICLLVASLFLSSCSWGLYPLTCTPTWFTSCGRRPVPTIEAEKPANDTKKELEKEPANANLSNL